MIRAALLGTTLLLSLTGCSTAVALRDRGPVVSDPPTWAGFLASSAPAGWESSRNNTRLDPRADERAYPLDQWPRTPQPSLYRARYLSIPTSPQSQMYLRDERAYDRGGLIWR